MTCRYFMFDVEAVINQSVKQIGAVVEEIDMMALRLLPWRSALYSAQLHQQLLALALSAGGAKLSAYGGGAENAAAGRSIIVAKIMQLKAPKALQHLAPASAAAAS
jgi:hypothetical protein